MKIIIISLFISINVLAALDEQVLIKGVIGNNFNEAKVSVTDSFGQKYDIPRKYFSKDLKIKSGDPFSIEIPEIELDKIKVKIKK